MNKKLLNLSNLCVFLLIICVLLSSCNLIVPLPDKTDTQAKETSTTVPETSGAKELPVVRDLTFISLNDVHGYIEQDENHKNGFSNTKYAIDNFSKYYKDGDPSTTERDDIILFANGDMFQGTAISNMSKGRAVLEAMNKMGFDAMGIGNHEFDWGLETILQYWDGDIANGEANFPLITSNISKNSKNGVLIGSISSQDNIVNYLLIEKEGVKIGLIAEIGPCQNSILSTRLTDYTFEDPVSCVKEAGLALKALGAELICVSIHYDPQFNEEMANLKDNNGNHMINLIFNGHTHAKEKFMVTCEDGYSIPCVQGGSNNYNLAYVSLSYNTETKKVTYKDYDYREIKSVGENCDTAVEKVIDDYADNLLANLPTLATSNETIKNKSNLYSYVKNILISAFDTDYAITNTGGLRSTGGIKKGEAITEANLYEIIPFDNSIYYIEIKAGSLYKFYKDNFDYYIWGVNDSKGALPYEYLQNSNDIVTVAIIDYVYTSNYFAKYLSTVTKEVETNLTLRDMLIADVTRWGELNERWTPYDGARISKQTW